MTTETITWIATADRMPDDYRAPRPRLTDEQHAAAVARAFPPKEIE